MSDEVKIQMPLPLDSDDFLRRECPTCEREFKWLPSEEPAVVPEAAGYYCPYCGVQASSDSWWTKPQIEYRNALVMRKIVAPGIKEFQRGLSQMARRSRGTLDFKPGGVDVDEPDPLVEPDDMRRVDFVCHPTEPIKISEEWTSTVHCMICGSTTE